QQISIIIKRARNLSKGQLCSSTSEDTICTQFFYLINPQRFLAMMISIIMNKVKNLSKAWLRSNNSNSVFKYPVHNQQGKMAFHDDFNHHILWHSLFQQATPNKRFQEQRIPQIMDVEMNPPWVQNQKNESL
ncbi:unnamed protein product, partial [Prunus brigantina]